MFSCSRLPQLLLQSMSPKLGMTNSGTCQNLTFSKNVPPAPVAELTFKTAFFPFGHRPGLSIAHQNKQD